MPTVEYLLRLGDDVPFKFSENDALNPELVGACGGMEVVTSHEKDF